MIAEHLKKQIENHLIQNPIVNRGQAGCYNQVAEHFGVKPEYIRNVYRRLRSQGQVELKKGGVHYIQFDTSYNEARSINTEFSGEREILPVDTYNVIPNIEFNVKEWKVAKPELVNVPEEVINKFLTSWKHTKNQEGLHVVVGCMHLPAVNDKLFNAFTSFLQDNKKSIKGLHLIGDILDCKSLSMHDLGQVSNVTLEEEYEKSNLYLDIIDEVLEGVELEKNYIWGNHEERYTRNLSKNDIAKYGGALLSPTRGCRFIERGYTVQEDYKNAKIQLGNHLDLIHGEYVTQNSAKKHLDVYKKSIMFAHTHKMGAHYDGDKASFNIGWMGDKTDSSFNYCSGITKGQWQNGFAVVNIDENGFYHVQLIQWYNDRFYYGGKQYK